jgi:predicted RNase H-like HicB family nuclease
MKKLKITVPLPVFIAREGKWFVASCPLLDIATQGKTEEEVKSNMEDLIEEYFDDPDTPKPEIKSIMSVSLTNIPIDIPEGIVHGRKTSTTKSR